MIPASIPLLRAGSISFTFFLIEFGAGWYSGSLAILSDSLNLLVDVVGYSIAIASVEIGAWEATSRFTFGFQRVELVGAMVGILLNWGLAIGLLAEAAIVLKHPVGVNAPVMMATATLGFLRSLCMTYALQKSASSWASYIGLESGEEGKVSREDEEDDQNINVVAAVVRTYADLLGSIFILISSVILLIKPKWTLIDPICTILVAVIIFAATFGLIEEYMNILMEGSPSNICIDTINEALVAVPAVKAVKSLKVWTLTQGKLVGIVELLAECPQFSPGTPNIYHDDITSASLATETPWRSNHDFLVQGVKDSLASFGIHESYVQVRYTR
ncbi:cation efflux family-domain-containing protein [Obelidium mucronatum]|nr:cation efflux family-domain-containing protein [Obelidium mucronatum]